MENIFAFKIILSVLQIKIIKNYYQISLISLDIVYPYLLLFVSHRIIKLAPENHLTPIL